MKPNFTFRRPDITKGRQNRKTSFNDQRFFKMTDTSQKQLGKTLLNIADQLRGAMDADDFRD